MDKATDKKGHEEEKEGRGSPKLEGWTHWKK